MKISIIGIFSSGRHYVAKEIVIIIVIQTLLFAGLFACGLSPTAFFAAGLISLLCIVQGIVSLGENPDARRNILFPSFLIKHRIVSGFALACIMASPFVYSLLSGEPVSWQYDEFIHVTLNSVSTAEVTFGLEICLLILLSRSSGVCELVKKGFPWQNIIRTIFLDISFVCVLLFIKDSENADSVDLYIQTHNALNGLFLTIFFYILMSSIYVIAAYVFLHERSMRTKLFSNRDMLLLEPGVVLFFVNGITTKPGDMPFTEFTAFCPIVIFIISALIGFFAVQGSSASRDKIPLSFKSRVTLINFAIYEVILAVKYKMVFLIAPNAMLFVWIIMSIAVGSLNKWMAHRESVRAIGELNKGEHGESWFDEKLRIYHEMKAKQ